MPANEASSSTNSTNGVASDDPLELVTDDATWTAVPAESSETERVTQWVSFEPSLLCDVDEWR